jgi:membrane protein
MSEFRRHCVDEVFCRRECRSQYDLCGKFLVSAAQHNGGSGAEQQDMWKFSWRTFCFLRNVFARYLREQCPMMAAAMAYYAVFSLPPLAMILLFTAGALWGENPVRGQLETQLEMLFGPVGKTQILDLMAHHRQVGGGWLGPFAQGAVLLFGATGLVLQLQYALNRIWGESESCPRRVLLQRIIRRSISALLILGGSLLLILSLILTAVLKMLATLMEEALSPAVSVIVEAWGHRAISMLIMTLLLAALFRWLPDTRVRWRDVALGALVTALLLLIGKELLGTYLGRRDPASFGAAGALVLLLVWVYYSSLILLWGAVFTRTWIAVVHKE